jgi:ATP/maltotriose-dependent transcriptional regulator MalT
MIVERLLKDLAPLEDRIWLVIDDVHELGSDQARRHVATVHREAAGWFAGHGYPVEAIRHAQAARDWAMAARLLADHWPGLYLDGQAATAHELLAGFPPRRPRRMPSSRHWPQPTSWRRDRWRRRNGTLR